MNWLNINSKVVSLTNIHNRVNADILFVSLVMGMEKKGKDFSRKFKISEIPKLIPRGTAGINNYSVYGFSLLSMLSGQKQRDYFLYDNPHLLNEFTTVANNRNRDNYYWLKNYPDEWVKINQKYLLTANKGADWMFDFDIESLGFTKEDINAIEDHFLCRIDIEDWESILLFKNDEDIFKYLFIENEDKDSVISTLLEMGSISADDLVEGQSIIQYMIEDDENIFKLSNGKWALFTDELLHKETLAQID